MVEVPLMRETTTAPRFGCAEQGNQHKGVSMNKEDETVESLEVIKLTKQIQDLQELTI